MKNKHLFALWAFAYLLTALLGFVRENTGAARGLLTCLAIGFFIPPGVLLWRAKKHADHRTRKLIRSLSAASLGLTAAFLVLNFLTVLSSQSLGNFLHRMLGMVSAPMFCGGSWALSLFLWACLFFAAL